MRPEQTACLEAMIHGRLITMSQWDGGQSFQLCDHTTQRHWERGRKSIEAEEPVPEGTDPEIG